MWSSRFYSVVVLADLMGCQLQDPAPIQQVPVPASAPESAPSASERMLRDAVELEEQAAKLAEIVRDMRAETPR